MTDDELEAFLNGRHTMNVATYNHDGTIHLVAMWYGFVDGDPAFWTYKTSQKIRNIERDPRVSFHAGTPGGGAYVVAEGIAAVSLIATTVDDPTVQELIDVYRLIQGEHPDWQDYRTAMVTDHRLLIRITLTRLYGWIPG